MHLALLFRRMQIVQCCPTFAMQLPIVAVTSWIVLFVLSRCCPVPDLLSVKCCSVASARINFIVDRCFRAACEFQLSTTSGKLPLLMDNWEKAIPERSTLSPCLAMWYSDLGALNKFMHIWPYASMNERMETRAKAVAGGSWPPSAKAKKDGREAVNYVAQENKIVMPEAFSPVQ